MLLLVPGAVRGLGGLDLFREHARVQRAGRLVLVNVLTPGLVTLNEIPSLASEAVRSTEEDQHMFGTPPCTRIPACPVGSL
jgi:hypothetical protein